MSGDFARQCSEPRKREGEGWAAHSGADHRVGTMPGMIVGKKDFQRRHSAAVGTVPYVPDQEINASATEVLHCALVRSGIEEVVVNLPDLVPVDAPEWVGRE